MRLTLAVLCLLLTSCVGVQGGLTIDAEGWTVVTESSDTVKIYVSSSEGNDANDGLSEATAVASLAVGYDKLRDGYPDWLLLKQGDTWTEERFTNEWTKSGRSEQERLVIMTYGDDERPTCLYSGSFIVNEKTGVPCSHLLLLGINVRNHVADPTSVDYDPDVILQAEENGSGIEWREAGENFRIEDCSFRGFSNGVLAFNTSTDEEAKNFQLRRCQIYDNRGQGMLVRGQTDFLVEGCLVDQNGWRIHRDSDVKEYRASTKKHNCYITNLDMHNVIIRDSIISRAGSHGIHFRPGGLCENNLFIDNPIALETGYANNFGQPGTVHGVTFVMRDCVMVHGLDINSSMIRGSGPIITDTSDALIENNIIAFCLSRVTNSYGFQVKEFNGQPALGVKIRNNITYDWWRGGIRTSGTVEILENTGNYFWDEANPGAGNFKSEETNFTNPRTIADYQKSLLPKAELARTSGFLNLARQQSKRSWDTRFTAPVVNQYIRDGFAIAP